MLIDAEIIAHGLRGVNIGNTVIDEYNGTSYAQYTWGPGGQVRRGSEFTLYDGLGSVTKITDGSGTPTEQVTFDSSGREQKSRNRVGIRETLACYFLIA